MLSERNLSWFWKKVAEGAFSATVALSRLGADGYPVSRLARVTAGREEGADSWVRLACEVPGSSLDEERFQDAFEGFLRARAGEVDPSFGHIAFGYTLGKTALEEILGPPWLLPEDTIPESRTWLRGYAWMTVLSREIAARLGVASLRRRGAFHEVGELPGGSVWLRATPRFADFHGEPVRRVWVALAPALRPGDPTRFDTGPGEAPLPVVYEDAGQAASPPA